MRQFIDLAGFAAAMFGTNRALSWRVFVLMLASSILDSFGLFLLLPMLHLVVDEGIFGGGGARSTMIREVAGGVVEVFPFNDTLLSILTIYLLIQLVRAVTSAGSSISTAQLRESFVRQSRTKLYDLLIHAPWQTVSTLKSHEISFHLTGNIQQLSQTCFQFLRIVDTVVLGLVYAVLAFWAGPFLVAILLPFGVIYYFTYRRFYRETVNQSARLRDMRIEHMQRGQQFVGKYRKVQAFSRQHREAAADREHAESMANAQVRIAKVLAGSQFVQNVMIAVLLCLIVFVAMRLLNYEFASLLLIVLAAGRLFPRIMSLQTQMQAVGNVIPSFKSFQELVAKLEADQQIKADAVYLPDLQRLEIPQVDLPPRLVYQDSEFVLERGRVTALVGPSGAGKSTLCDVLQGFLPGLVEYGALNGTAIGKPEAVALARQCAYLEQQTMFWQATVRDALSWANPDATEQDMIDVLTKVGLAGRILDREEGLDTSLGDAGHWLSGGEIKRLALAQVLLLDAHILILDEFTANLDPETEEEVLGLITRLKADRMILIVTHKEAPLKIAEHIFTIRGRQPGAQSVDRIVS